MKNNLLFLGFLFFSASLTAMEPGITVCNDTPLHVAASKGNIKLLVKALEGSVTECRYDEWGLVEIIDHTGAALLELRDSLGRTALHRAVMANSLKIVRYLTGQGAKREALDADGYTPALIAAAHGRTSILGYLLLEKPERMITPKGKSMLHVAVTAQQGDPLRTIALLLERGDFVNAIDNSLSTPLHDALRAQAAPSIIYFLLEKGAHLDAKDKEGVTARSLLKAYRERAAHN